MPAWLPACCSLYAVSTLVSPSTAIVLSSYYYDVLSTSPTEPAVNKTIHHTILSQTSMIYVYVVAWVVVVYGICIHEDGSW